MACGRGVARTPRPLAAVGILGAGMMGTAIAALAARHELPVVLSDVDPQALDQAPARLVDELAAGGMPATEAHRQVDRLVQTNLDPVALADCELVIESAREDLHLKRRIYKDLENYLAKETILATNTSTIPIEQLALELARPGRFCGIHFFHPVAERQLVEVVRGPKTEEVSITRATAFARSIDKLPIVVGDGPGFLVNRLLLAYASEALELLLDGASIQAIERTATQFGMAKGPLRLLDEIGLDTALAGGLVLRDAFPDRITASPLLIGLVKARRLGRKSGGGFFRYAENGEPTGVEPEFELLLAKWARPPQPSITETITARLFLPMILEASRILEEGRVCDPRDVDRGMLFGLGFPASRGGLLYWADSLGTGRIIETLGTIRALGKRAEPTAMLLDLAARGGRFYDGFTS